MLLIALALLTGGSQQFDLDNLKWGQSLSELQSEIPDLTVSPSSGTTPGELENRASATIRLSDAVTVRVRFFFTPLSHQLGAVNVDPEPQSLCFPLLAEFRQKLGAGVDTSLIPEMENWQFSDLRANTQWNYVITKLPNSTTCTIHGTPLLGTQDL